MHKSARKRALLCYTDCVIGGHFVTSFLKQFSVLLALLIPLAFLFAFAPRAHAQSCSGICINVPGVSSSGGGTSRETFPSNISVRINGGAACTDSKRVTVTVEYSESTYFEISPDNDFENEDFALIQEGSMFTPPKHGDDGKAIRFFEIPWTLQGGDGQHQVYVRLRSSSVNVSGVYSDSILLQTSGCGGAEPIEPPEDLDLYPGLYIKGESFPAVYYLDENLRRRPFINETVYFTHKPDFEGIRVISDELLSTIPLGQPMLPKEGRTLVKVQDDPRVYYVDPNMDGQFRWIVNEGVAVLNFGTDWQEFLIDIPPTLFPHIVFDGSIVSDESFDLSLLIPRLLLTGQKFTADSDGDGLTDFLEFRFGSDMSVADSDDDGLDDGGEYFYKTNPFDADSDDDGFTDGDEVRDGFNPLGTGVLDSDGDGLDDPQEFFYSTDRYSADTDGDGYSDKTEIDHGFDPLGPGLLKRELSGFSVSRYVVSALDLTVRKIRSLLPF